MLAEEAARLELELSGTAGTMLPPIAPPPIAPPPIASLRSRHAALAPANSAAASSAAALPAKLQASVAAAPRGAKATRGKRGSEPRKGKGSVSAESLDFAAAMQKLSQRLTQGTVTLSSQTRTASDGI